MEKKLPTYTKMGKSIVGFDVESQVVFFEPFCSFDGKLISAPGWRMSPEEASEFAQKIMLAVEQLTLAPAPSKH